MAYLSRTPIGSISRGDVNRLGGLVQFSCQPNGLTEAIAQMNRARDTIEESMSRALDELANDAKEDLKAATPVLTGYMRAHWRVIPGVNSRTVTDAATYAVYLFMGTYKMQPNAALVSVMGHYLHDPRLVQYGFSVTTSLGWT